MNEFLIILLCSFGTTIIACVFDYLYFSKRYNELQEKIVPDVIVLENEVTMLKNEIIHMNGRISQLYNSTK